MGRWGSKVPNSLVKTTIQSFLLQTSRNVPKHAIRGWVGVQSPKQIHGILSEKLLISSKKIKCSKQPKKQNKPNFYSSPSGVPNVHGGWVGPDVWDKVPKKSFFLTPSLISLSGSQNPFWLQMREGMVRLRLWRWSPLVTLQNQIWFTSAG